MGLYVNWIGVTLFLCGGVAMFVASGCFTVSSAARSRALMMGVFQTRSDFTAKGWQLWVAGLASAVLGFVLVGSAQLGLLGNF